MEDNYTNELVEVDGKSGHQPSKESYEATIQMMQNFTGIIIGLAQQAAENNAAKYRAQAEVLIADIQAKMQAELQDINGYYNVREKQEEYFNKIITSYQEQFKILTNQLIFEDNEKKAVNIKWAIEKLESGVGKMLEQLAESIASEQSTRLEVSKPRNRGLFDFLKEDSLFFVYTNVQIENIKKIDKNQAEQKVLLLCLVFINFKIRVICIKLHKKTHFPLTTNPTLQITLIINKSNNTPKKERSA